MSDFESRATFDSKNIFDPAVLAELGDFRLRARKLASGLTFGVHASNRRGASTEFRDHRPWESGDDPKFIDWRVFARTGRLFTRRFVEDTNTNVYFLLDHTPGMAYRGAGSPLSKWEYAQCLAAALSYLALQQGDRVAASAFHGSKMVHLRANAGDAHWTETLAFLENPPLDASLENVGTCADILNRFASECTRRGTIFILSDLLNVGDFSEIRPQLEQLCAARHDIRIFHILDSDETTFPFESLSEFVSLDDSRRRLTTNPSDVRQAYLANFDAWRRDLSEGCRSLGVRFQKVLTTAPLHRTLWESAENE